jgi:hypothetical protein
MVDVYDVVPGILGDRNGEGEKAQGCEEGGKESNRSQKAFASRISEKDRFREKKSAGEEGDSQEEGTATQAGAREERWANERAARTAQKKAD